MSLAQHILKEKLGHVRRHKRLLISPRSAVHFSKEYFLIAIRSNLLLILQVYCEVDSLAVVTNFGKTARTRPPKP